MQGTPPRLIVFASGSQDGGGSGFEKLVLATENGMLCSPIVAVVSNHQDGGVRKRADRFGIPFIHSPKGRTSEDYRRIVQETRADFVALSGWLGQVEGLDPRTTFNIHPALIPSPFCGKGFHGHHVHEAVIAAYRRGEITHTGVTMHFVTSEYDSEVGVFFRKKVRILPDDTPDSIAAKVNRAEHKWQAIITNHVVCGRISWDGKSAKSIVAPELHRLD
ncbi:MAG: formyltransferase family protein [Candidatus Paceibacterota bacterium]|jgi:folate-dependent phosphoribosylglycinamide formyltransferase PurN